MSIITDIKHSYKDGTIVTKLIYINLVVFLILRLVPFALWIFRLVDSPQAGEVLLSYISVPSNPSQLILRPWTLVTYMFVHFQFLHVLFNVLYIYWFGRLFLSFLKPHQLLGIYIIGGISGALVYLLAYNLMPVFYSFAPSAILMGASASAMAILFAVAVYAPNHTIYMLFLGPVKLKYIALAALLIDLVSMTTLQNTGGHLAHMGGALAGVIFVTLLKKKIDITKHFNFKSIKLNNPFKRKGKMTVTHKRAVTDLEYNTIKKRKQQEVDFILDKIKRSGYDSLTKEEKKILFEASKE